ncbi:MAG: MATE family efflux transporter, partial [Evtepia gabavorous]
MILTQIIMGITTGGNILMGQYFDSKDRSNRVKTNRTMFGFALSAGALLSVLLFLLSRPILAALRAPALEEATAYLQVCSAGLIAIFGYNALAAMLRSVGNSKQPFYCGRDSGLQHCAGLSVYGGLPMGRAGRGPGHGACPVGQLCGLPGVCAASPGLVWPGSAADFFPQG